MKMDKLCGTRKIIIIVRKWVIMVCSTTHPALQIGLTCCTGHFCSTKLEDFCCTGHQVTVGTNPARLFPIYENIAPSVPSMMMMTVYL